MEPFKQTLADRLRTQIRAGTLTPGQFLPMTEAELARQHGLSRGTVRAGLQILVAEGLLVGHQGRGYQVKVRRPLIWVASMPERNDGTMTPSDTWSRDVIRQGRTPSEQITVQIGRADAAVAGWMGCPLREPVSMRLRLRCVDGEPYSYANSYYLRSVVAGTRVELPDDLSPGVYEVFAELGRPWVLTTDDLNSRWPTEEECKALGMSRTQPVVEIARRSYDAGGVAVRLTVFVLPTDRHLIQYQLPEVAA